MNKVYPLLHVEADLTPLRELVNQLVGLDLSVGIKGQPEALIALTKLLQPVSTDTNALQQSDIVQKHFMFAFVMAVDFADADSISDTEYLNTSRYALNQGYLMIVSANLSGWGRAMSDVNLTRCVPAYLKEIKSYFVAWGLGPIFK